MPNATELVILALQSDSTTEDTSATAGQHMQKLLDTVSAPKGFQRQYYGRELEDPTLLVWTIGRFHTHLRSSLCAVLNVMKECTTTRVCDRVRHRLGRGSARPREGRRGQGDVIPRSHGLAQQGRPYDATGGPELPEMSRPGKGPGVARDTRQDHVPYQAYRRCRGVLFINTRVWRSLEFNMGYMERLDLDRLGSAPFRST